MIFARLRNESYVSTRSVSLEVVYKEVVMPRKRIGQLLQNLVPLSAHDVDEILHEQAHSQRPFGEIALDWGLCQPEHIWQAWCIQLADKPQRIDLDEFGIDARALVHLTGAMARRFGVIPVRVYGEKLVLAGDEAIIKDAAPELRKRLQVDLLFVVADRRVVLKAIERYYAPRAIDEGIPAPGLPASVSAGNCESFSAASAA
jgi:type IV pilus assembly protein PilB